MYDVVVIGGGPAGSAVAYEASKNKDLKVTIREKREVIGRPYQCAGGLSVPLFRSEMPELWDEMPQNLIKNRIKKVVIRSRNNEITWGAEDLGCEEIGIILDRTAFDQWLCARAIKNGAGIMKCKVTGITVDLMQVGVQMENCQEIKTKIVIGADGARSKVGRWAGMVGRIPQEDLHQGYQETIEIKEYPEDTIVMWFDTRFAPKGYVWAFPEGSNMVRLGLGIPLNIGYRNVRQYLEAFKMNNKDYSYDGDITFKTSGLLSTRPPMDSCVNKHGNVALVGCAGAHTSALHGGGILHAIIAGTELGQVIAEGKPLSEYDVRWKEKLWQRLVRHYKLKQMICGFDDSQMDRMCKVMGSFKMQSENVDKEILRFIKHVVRRDPRLIPEFVTKVVKG